MLTPSLEDYLEEIYRFSSQKDVVRVTDISHRLDVAMPSVTKALRKLKEQGYIAYQRYGVITLTEQGNLAGTFLVARNQIIQDFLTCLYADCNIPAEAEAIEHYLSATTIKTFRDLVNFMKENPDIHQKLQEYLIMQNKKDSAYAKS